VAVAARDGAPRADAPDHDDDFAALRALLIGPEQQQLRDLKARLDDPAARVQEVGRVLPAALLLRSRDADLARALTPPVEQAITASVRRNPHPLAEALFPVMGPAIRRAVTAGLAAMMDSLNRTLEHSLSWRALQWRITAVRTGKSFAEIVLLHTLVYRVEQIFLIDRRTGLLLQHVRAGTAPVQDADMVSGMLTAIRDFVHDSFRVAASESLDALQVGELSVWIEQGPRAVIAAVIRGTAPAAYRRTLQRALETIHLEHADALERFDGDASAFDAARPVLEACLQTEYQAPVRRRHRLRWVVAALLVAAALVWAGIRVRDRARWQTYVAALRAEPGIVVVSWGSAAGGYFVEGLRDPLARDPAQLLSQAKLNPADVTYRWEPYQALTERFVLARAHRLLQPPAGVTLALRDGILRADGDPPLAWTAEARRLAPFVPGVERLDSAAHLDAARRRIAERVAGATLLFGKGTTALLPGQETTLADVGAALRELDALAEMAGESIRVEAVGHTDTDGADTANLPLSRARADRTIVMLNPQSLPHLVFAAVGVGSHQPAVAEGTESAMQRNRRVQLRVTPARRETTSEEPRR
jgi:OOP family OmpA-OmpF porin